MIHIPKIEDSSRKFFYIAGAVGLASLAGLVGYAGYNIISSSSKINHWDKGLKKLVDPNDDKTTHSVSLVNNEASCDNTVVIDIYFKNDDNEDLILGCPPGCGVHFTSILLGGTKYSYGTVISPPNKKNFASI